MAGPLPGFDGRLPESIPARYRRLSETSAIRGAISFIGRIEGLSGTPPAFHVAWLRDRIMPVAPPAGG